MALNWQEILGWGEEQFQELRIGGFTLLRQGHYQKAILFFHALCILLPKSSYDYQILGALYLETGQHKTALETLNKALSLDPQHEPTLLNRVKALFMNKQIELGLTEAKNLTTSQDPLIASDAHALIIAYS